MNCLECGEEFEPNKQGPKKRFCLASCQAKYWRENTKNGKEYRKKQLQKTIEKRKKQTYKWKCLVCGYIWNDRNHSINKLNYHPYHCPSCLSNNWDFGDNLPCLICKRIVFIPRIHHIDGIHKNNSFENRTPLCTDCHTAVHHGIGINNQHKLRGSGGKTPRRLYGAYGGGNTSRKHILDQEIINKIKMYQEKLK